MIDGFEPFWTEEGREFQLRRESRSRFHSLGQRYEMHESRKPLIILCCGSANRRVPRVRFAMGVKGLNSVASFFNPLTSSLWPPWGSAIDSLKFTTHSA